VSVSQFKARPELGPHVVVAYAFLFCLYFVPGGILSNIAPALFCMAAVWQWCADRRISLSQGTRAAIWFLVAAAVWISIPVALGSVGSNRHGAALGNVILLALLAAYVDQLSRRVQLERLLFAVVWMSTLSAVASLIGHIASGHTLADRLWPLGRGGNPIPGAGGFACGLIALWTLARFRRGPPLATAGAVASASLLLTAIAMAGSRGPIVALVLSLGLSSILKHKRNPLVLIAALVIVWGTVTGLVLFEADIKQAFCSDAYDFCRSSFRQGIWAWAREQVIAHPFFGTGPGFRFPDKIFNHPHNGVIGLAMFYGIPFAGACVAALLPVIRRLARFQGPHRTWAYASLLFSAGYMGSDLPNPFSFYNTHYLFFWIPLFYVMAYPSGVEGGAIQAGPGV
jgi:O-antigen ligase/polysaccharide polymerase Wzy-like membrane protein